MECRSSPLPFWPSRTVSFGKPRCEAARFPQGARVRAKRARLSPGWLGGALAPLVFAGLCLGQGKPPASAVPEPYRQNFVKYVDARSWTEQALNKIGLTSQDVGRS